MSGVRVCACLAVAMARARAFRSSVARPQACSCCILRPFLDISAVAAADAARRAEADAGRPRLDRVFVMTNGAPEWVALLKQALAATGHYKHVASSRDLVLSWEQKYVAQAVDMLVGQRAQVFIGNGVRVSPLSPHPFSFSFASLPRGASDR